MRARKKKGAQVSLFSPLFFFLFSLKHATLFLFLVLAKRRKGNTGQPVRSKERWGKRRRRKSRKSGE